MSDSIMEIVHKIDIEVLYKIPSADYLLGDIKKVMLLGYEFPIVKLLGYTFTLDQWRTLESAVNNQIVLAIEKMKPKEE